MFHSLGYKSLCRLFLHVSFKNTVSTIINVKYSNLKHRDQPEICYPSKPTAYPVDISFIEKNADIDRFSDQFKFVDHELLLNRHIETRMNGVYESGLSIGRIFGLRMFIESHFET